MSGSRCFAQALFVAVMFSLTACKHICKRAKAFSKVKHKKRLCHPLVAGCIRRLSPSSFKVLEPQKGLFWLKCVQSIKIVGVTDQNRETDVMVI